MTKQYPNYGKKIREWRKGKGLSLLGLCAYLDRYYNNEHKKISPYTIHSLEKYGIASHRTVEILECIKEVRFKDE